MILETLEKNDEIRTLVNSIISDKVFKVKCKDNFNQIFDDKKVDKDDIPLIINLFLTVYNNQNKINVKKVQLKPVFMLLISRLLIEFQGEESKLDTNLILLLIEPQIDLLLASIRLSNCKFPCCGSKPDDEKESIIYQKMKLNKIEKQKVNERVIPPPLPSLEERSE